MKLVHEKIERHINFENANNYFLLIENPEEFFRLTQELVMQVNGEDGKWILSDIETLDIEKNLEVIYDYYTLSLNSKKADTYVKNQILKIAKEGDFLEDLSRINVEIINLNNKLMKQIDLPLLANEDVTFEDLYKISNFSIVEELSLPEKLLDFVDLQIRLRNIKVVVLISPFSYFSCGTLCALIKQFEYRDLRVLLIDTQNHKLPKNFEKIIIDKDLCVI